MIKAVFMTILTGIIGGFLLLLIEYIYIIPFFTPSAILLPPPISKACQCTPGKIFSEPLRYGGFGPEMVVLAAGHFRIGNDHDVSVSRFAISRYEISFIEYDIFAQETKRHLPNDNGWGRGNRPVINVSWHEANAYAEWLSQETNQRYRLPKEVEWEYAARADTDTHYWWGNEIGLNMANCEGCGSLWDNKKTAPVGSFAANPFKLYDTVGNVYEWTCSEYEEKYTETGKEQRCLSKHNSTALRAIRGGSWYSGFKFARVSNRYRFLPDSRDYNIGFRLVREIPKTK